MLAHGDIRLELCRLEAQIRDARLRPDHELLVMHALQVASREASYPSRVADALAHAVRLLELAGRRSLADALRGVSPSPASAS